MAIGELFIFLIAGVVAVVAITAKQNRRHNSFFDRKTCRRCNAVYPSNTHFCGRCGGRL